MKDELGQLDEKNGGLSETMVANFYPALQRYCRFLARNEWDGDDIAQEAILKAIRH
ncbi:sigma factor [Peribacillus glennii]|uniref:Uncharacterized protein n=1 Tax=Peribacillus glennii TaxID=2303991 RepID=A0A372LCC3_9BACI|nr:sigma factor [Peribacillus glennii]RFU63506.1 hypothetical protein D0466_12320 [Peribacillus glennii]